MLKPVELIEDDESLAEAMAAVASAMADASRLKILCALMDGRAWTATELSAVADISPSTASAHLSRLVNSGLLICLAQGRHRYYRLAGSQKNEGQNILQLAIRSRFKFIYRPAGLGNRDAAAEKLALSANGSSLSVSNPTPFYITVSRISRNGGKALNSKTVMFAPQSSQTIALSSAVSKGETLTVNNINDYGADVAVKVTVK